MNTTSLNQKINSLLVDFEQQCGQTIPSVTPFIDLYRDYCDWSLRNHMPAKNVAEFLFYLTDKADCMPCRLTDGSVGVIGIFPKAMMASGAMQ